MQGEKLGNHDKSYKNLVNTRGHSYDPIVKIGRQNVCIDQV
jgi:hypothetical protein